MCTLYLLSPRGEVAVGSWRQRAAEFRRMCQAFHAVVEAMTRAQQNAKRGSSVKLGIFAHRSCFSIVWWRGCLFFSKARKVLFSGKGVMWPMRTNLVISDESKTRARSAIVDSKPDRSWVRFLSLVFLILIELGAMFILCYKCEHPTAVSIFQRRWSRASPQSF